MHTRAGTCARTRAGACVTLRGVASPSPASLTTGMSAYVPTSVWYAQYATAPMDVTKVIVHMKPPTMLTCSSMGR